MSSNYNVLRKKAVALRKQGLTYSEILKKVPVAKSTFTLWFHEVKLAVHQKQRITEKRHLARLKGARVRKEKRIATEKVIISQAKEKIGKLSKRDLRLVGATLYWAEGTKQTERNISSMVIFSNSDPEMILLFRRWLKTVGNVPEKDIFYQLYIHLNNNSIELRNFWAKKLKITNKNSIRIYFKKHNPTKKGKADYHGLIRISVRKSTNLNRKIRGWIKGIYLGVV